MAVDTVQLRKMSSIAGALLINFLSRPAVYWGNMAVYVLSYHVFLGQSGTPINNAWFYVFYSSGWTTTMLSTDVLTRWVKPRYLIVAGLIVFNSFFFGSAFSEAISWTSYVFLFSFVVASGLGLFESLVLKHYVVDWATDQDKGMLTSLFVTSSSAGAAVANLFMTFWTNPGNLIPDLCLGNFVLFSYDEVCERVPSMFLIMGGASVGLQFIGFCLLRERRRSPITLTIPDGSTDFECTPSQIITTKYNSFDCECDAESGSNLTRNTDDDKNSTEKITMPSPGINSLGDEKDETILKYISNPDFQRLFFIFYALGQGLEVTASLYKTYGSVWIKNDFFFSALGTAMVVPGIFSNIFIGKCLDKFGLRLCFVVLCSLLSLLFILMYFSAMLNPAFYFVVTVFAYTFSGGMYSCVTASTVILFGSRHLSRNFALVSSASILSSITASVVAEVTLAYGYDWFWVFAWVSFVAILALIVSTGSFPESRKDKQPMAKHI